MGRWAVSPAGCAVLVSNKHRRVLGLPSKAQAATIAHEDALMQKVAGAQPAPEPDATTARTDEVVADVEQMAMSAIGVIDESVPYAIVAGEPGVQYVQGRNFFDRGKRFVREAPMSQWYISDAVVKKVSAMDRADEARRELARKGLFEGLPTLPQSEINRLRENARAAAAEAHAE